MKAASEKQVVELNGQIKDGMEEITALKKQLTDLTASSAAAKASADLSLTHL